MTDREAIEALKMINLRSVHPFYDWKEMVAVRELAIFALQERVERAKGCDGCVHREGETYLCYRCSRYLHVDWYTEKPLKGTDNGKDA